MLARFVSGRGLGLALALLTAGLLPGCKTEQRAAPRPPEKRLALATGSAELLRPELPGVELEQTLTELLRVRPRLRRQPAADREQLTVYEEELGPKRRALYFFGGPSQRLARVQLATELDRLEAIVDRVLERQQRMGAPTGVWDCPASAGQLPTRRYGYQRAAAAAADVYAIVGEHGLATYYVTSREQLRSSLALAGCTPPPPERTARFPAVPTHQP